MARKKTPPFVIQETIYGTPPVNQAEAVNKLYYGDNLEILRRYIRDESIDLCYIDPPFNSNRTYNQIYNNIGGEDKAQAQAFIDTWEWDIYADEGFGEILGNANRLFTKRNIELILGLSKVLGKGSLLAYLVSMTLRMVEIQRVLKSTGSFYLHCDPNASHYLKLVLDSIFCDRGGEFRNEVIWDYTFRLMDLPKFFNRKHDVILFYSKGKENTFNMPKTEWSRDSLLASRKQKIHVDEHGVEWIWMPGGKGNSKNKLRKVDEIIEQGKAISDVWQIPIISSSSKERLGYPTQKPEILLERIIKASSNEGDAVLDAYCGCGTTVAVAEKLKRKWVGIDITYQSISLILKRLEDSFGKHIIDAIELNGVPKDLESAVALANKKDDRVRKEFEKWAVLTYSNNKALINEKRGADQGIDGVAFMMEGEETFKDILFSVKSGHSALSHIRDFCHVVERDDAAIGIYLTLDEPTKQMKKEARQMGVYENPLTKQAYDKVKIVTVQEMLDGERLNAPTSPDVLKSAQLKSRNLQQELGFEF